MSSGYRFNAFAGVFTPSVLTILGVIMYLRLPWIVGSGGLATTIGIILVAHIISVTTGLSVSSIATDKSVQAGGPYYIISRSLGLPVGGTLGLALFVGLSFSISLYIIGFSESFMSYLGYVVDDYAIRFCGSITLIALTVLTFISTALAIKTQYLILGAIALSLLSIFAGPYFGDGLENLEVTKPVTAEYDIGVLFGIFFPAVTGFTAGVNMSGDLKDPRKAIPRGTLSAISVGLVVYLGLAVFLDNTVDSDALLDREILLKISLYAPFVVAGIWGATLSSALGSILGAPRILQALSLDNITARIFGRGHGTGNEPRNALILSFVIAEVGILMAELDVIARIISMFFLATYGFLNLSCAIESWASPDFRPEFKIPRWISVLGLLTCGIIMFKLDFLAMFAAVILLSGVFLYLKKRELTLESGDTWEGVWSSVVRSGLHQLTVADSHHRNWRPNILLFSRTDDQTRPEMLKFGHSLISRRGVLTDIELYKGKQTPKSTDGAPPVGVFRRPTPFSDAMTTIGNVARFHGFTGMEPNTVMMEWNEHRADRSRFVELLNELKVRDMNVLLLALDKKRGFGEHKRLDIWLSAAAENQNAPISFRLIQFITSSDDWRRAKVRFLIHNTHSASSEDVYNAIKKQLDDDRMDATIKVINDAVGERTFEEWIRSESSGTDLAVAPLPLILGDMSGEYLDRANTLIDSMSSILLVRSSAAFQERLTISTQNPIDASLDIASEVTPEDSALPDVKLPEVQVLADEVRRFAAQHDALVSTFHEKFVKPAYDRNSVLMDRATTVVKKYFAQLEKALSESNPRRQEKLVSRAQSAFFFQSKKLLKEFKDTELTAQQSAMWRGITSYLEEAEGFVNAAPMVVNVTRPTEEFKSHPDDTQYIRWFKLRRRLSGWLKGTKPSYNVRMTPLRSWYLDHCTQEALFTVLERFAQHGYQCATQLSKLLVSVKTSLAQIGSRRSVDHFSPEFLAAEKDRVLEGIEKLSNRNVEHVGQARLNLLVISRELAQALAEDLSSLDVHQRTRKLRRIPASSRALRAQLSNLPTIWRTNHTLVFERAGLALLIASLQQRLVTIVHRVKTSLLQKLQTGILRECEKLVETLKALRDEFGSPETPRLKITHDFSNQFDDKQVIDDFVREIHAAINELPENLGMLSDDGITSLNERPFENVETITVALRRLLQFLIDAEFVAKIEEETTSVPVVELRAINVAQDVVRLISLDLSDFEGVDSSDESFRRQMLPIIDNGIARIEAEVDKLRQLKPNLMEQIDEQLELLLDSTDAYAITASEETLQGYIRKIESPVLTIFGRVSNAVSDAVRTILTTLFYRRSAGVLLARKIRSQQERSQNVVEQTLQLVTDNVPSERVLESLPFYYRQLFLGRTTITDAFWVGRESEMNEVEIAIQNYRRGFMGALMVTGERGSGKTSLCRRIAETWFPKADVHHIFAPSGGSCDPAVFKSAIEKSVQFQGDYDALFQTTAENNVIVLHEIELWWERSEDGLAVIEVIQDLIDRFSERCFFILNADIHSFKFINGLTPLSDAALAVVECGPMDAEALNRIITLRHRSTGLLFELDGRDETQLANWKLARLYNAMFDYSDGVVGTALQAWLTHIDDVSDDHLSMHIPKGLNLDVIDDLRMEWVALLLQLILHRQVTLERLEHVTQLNPSVLRRHIDTLIRMGLVEKNKQEVIEINRFVHHMVIKQFAERGLLP